jgi:hypothetical protein
LSINFKFVSPFISLAIAAIKPARKQSSRNSASAEPYSGGAEN